MRGALLALLSLTLPAAAWSQPWQWAEGTDGLDDGATRDFYNRGALLPWTNFLGDWHDADDVPQGDRAHAVATVVDDDTGRFIEWDVTGLVASWVDGAHRNQGLLLRKISGPGTLNFRSREHVEPTEHPSLELRISGMTTNRAPVADTHLSPSTYRAQGASDSLRVDNDAVILMRFDLSDLAPGTVIESARLRIFTFPPQFGGSSSELGVFRCSHGHDLPPSDPVRGLAQGYPNDEGIDAHPDVIFSASFESATWDADWSTVGGNVDTVDSDPTLGFEPLLGRALRNRIPEAGNTGLNVRYVFPTEIGSEPEEIYFRYYLRLADDWRVADGGKLPGIAGRYGTAGWGGRRADGTNGWSARGLFQVIVPDDNPLEHHTPTGFYCYHADQATTYGDNWLWQEDYRGLLERNRWYCIEQYCRMNTPGVPDGVLRAWVDGRLAFEKTDIRFRDVPTLRIEEIWLNVYHGGTAPSPYDQHSYVDNVVIARDYIGPLAVTERQVVRSSVAADLPGSPAASFPVSALPFTDPDDVFGAGFPALLFYQLVPDDPVIELRIEAGALVVDERP
ncbi:MAG: DNRLRE domain-containing protein [Acidobacteriota bacterium]